MLCTKRTKPSLFSSSSVDTVANNDDLLTEILLCLPIKSLLKFKLVSKRWLSLISNPQFSRRRSPRVSSPSALFLRSYLLLMNPEYDFFAVNNSTHSTAPPFTTLTFVDDSAGIEIIQSCNGLLLCRSYRRYRSKRNYYVYNPTTKQYTILPPQLHLILGVSLAFDPSKSPDYKAVCVSICDTLQDHYQIQIHSSKSGPWRISGVPFTAEDDIEFDGGVFCNGAIHWISGSGTSLYFDVDQEQLKQMPMPQIPDDWDHRSVRYFGESRGSLYLVEIYDPPGRQFEVYELARDYSGWFLKYHVDVNVVASAFPEMARDYLDPSELDYYAFQILCVVKGESDDDSFLVLHIPGKLIRYDFKTKRFQKLHDFAPGGLVLEQEEASNFVLCIGYQYIESLACV